jgi:threonyl-tRNA synthetase
MAEKNIDIAQQELDIIRHSTAHLLAHAVKSLFSEVQLAIGPIIENGFYYDFYYPQGFSEKDLEKIESKMRELTKANHEVKRLVLNRKEACQLFHERGETYKLKLIDAIPEDEEITLYQQGDFIDLCRGPHVEKTGELTAFKLTKLAGAYWLGDSKNEMLQRIYGTAWANKEDLQSYLERLAEAEKRDHRKIGKAMNLFHTQEEAPGMVFWHNNGYIIYQAIIRYIREMLQQNDYQEIATPLILDRSLWEKSGHWDKFGENNMFTTESENRTYAIKPMNCPGHIQMFNQTLHSYRDLPVRTAEFGICHRNEPSGTLHGVMRIRQFTQDDAHIFCTNAQLQDEIVKLIKLVYKVYQHFGFTDIIVRLATRPERRIGDDQDWSNAEAALKYALDQQNIEWILAEGEGAFYGPKIEFHLRDCLQRIWQCGTIQVDFAMPQRLGAEYVNENSKRITPVMIHRVILGSIERFIGILLEHYAGLLPLWLMPVQAVVMNITNKQADYVENIAKLMQNLGLRVNSDLRNEKISFKIREHTIAKVPYMLVVGDRELENNAVSVRTNEGKDMGNFSIQEFVAYLQNKLKLTNKN